MLDAKDYSNLKLQLDGILGSGGQHKRGVLLDSMYAFLPKEPKAKIPMFYAEIMLLTEAATIGDIMTEFKPAKS
jgi:hypothetical protein